MAARSLTHDTVFVSYSRTDWKDYAEPLVGDLKQAGLQVWVDQNIIRTGDDWLDKINEALKICNRLILCVSPEALNSRYVKVEYRYFFRHDKPIYLIMCRQAELPPELDGIHYIDFSRRNELIRQLCSS